MSGPRTQRREIEQYNAHKKNIENATAVVDNIAPKLPLRVYIDCGKLYADVGRLKQIEIENQHLLQKINIINRTKGKVDCYQTKRKINSLYEILWAEQQILEARNQKFLNTLKEKLEPSNYSEVVLLPQWKKNLNNMIANARFPEFYKNPVTPFNSWSICPEGVVTNPSKRQMCYFDLSFDDVFKEIRMYIEIYSDIVPTTAKAFINNCVGWNNMSYKNSQIYRIIPDMFCLGGDIENFNGTGGMSIYGCNFSDENFILQHNGRGVVAMFNSNPGCNDSKFLITFKKLPTFNGRFVVIGRVVKTLRPLDLIEDCGTKSGKSLRQVIVTKCGLC